MEELLNTNIDPAMAASMAILGAGQVAKQWLAANPTAAAHLQSGWHLSVEVVVTSDPIELAICFVDVDGTRYPQGRVRLPASALGRCNPSA